MDLLHAYMDLLHAYMDLLHAYMHVFVWINPLEKEKFSTF